MNDWVLAPEWHSWTPRNLACWLAQRCPHPPSTNHSQAWIWLDSSGNFPKNAHPPQSLFFLNPHTIHQGNLHNQQNFSQLEAAELSSRQHGNGLAGWIDYEGDFLLAEFHDALRFDHNTQQWFRLGNGAEPWRSLPTQKTPQPFHLSPFQPQTSREEFLSQIQRAQQWIASGDIYQVNLSQSFLAKISGNSSLFPLYLALRDASPAPMSAWISLASREILSSSPELFLRLDGSRAETRPIKGTRPRGISPQQDAALAHELQTSEKELSELIMITDLLRNDLGQICQFHSVKVEQLCQLESLAQVHHLVSHITGQLSPTISPLHALQALHPGGSITGAPKKRAREIIKTLEQRPRNLYCGTIGYTGFHLGSQWNIAIRTLIREQQSLRYDVGAGIVADSHPPAEFQETLDKAAGIQRAIQLWNNQNPTPP